MHKYVIFGKETGSLKGHFYVNLENRSKELREASSFEEATVFNTAKEAKEAAQQIMEMSKITSREVFFRAVPRYDSKDLDNLIKESIKEKQKELKNKPDKTLEIVDLYFFPGSFYKENIFLIQDKYIQNQIEFEISVDKVLEVRIEVINAEISDGEFVQAIAKEQGITLSTEEAKIAAGIDIFLNTKEMQKEWIKLSLPGEALKISDTCSNLQWRLDLKRKKDIE